MVSIRAKVGQFSACRVGQLVLDELQRAFYTLETTDYHL
jgi:hypothetical protein